MTTHIRPATPQDLSYLLHLQKRFSNQIGYIPRAGYAGKIDNRQAWLILENDDPAGMLIATHRRDRRTHITQAAVDLDLQRSLHGARGLAYLAQAARFAGSVSFSCSVRCGLDAHAFWRACGFSPVRVRPGGKARRKDLIDYAASVDSVSRSTRALLAPKTGVTLIEPAEG